MVAMEFATIDPSIATFRGVHSGLAMGSIDLCGSDEQKQRWLPAMARWEKIGASRDGRGRFQVPARFDSRAIRAM